MERKGGGGSKRIETCGEILRNTVDVFHGSGISPVRN
jgi:hypothetical protein